MVEYIELLWKVAAGTVALLWAGAIIGCLLTALLTPGKPPEGDDFWGP